MLSFVFSLIILSLFEIGIGKATVLIREDGTVEPENSPIQKNGTVYYLMGDINQSVSILKNDIIFDGNGYIINPITRGVTIYGVDNVTVKNCIIKEGKEVGFMVDRSSNIKILNNTVTGTSVLFPGLQPTGGILFWIVNSSIISGNYLEENYESIFLGAKSQYNLIVANILINNQNGISLYDSSNNRIYKNNFINNTIQVYDNKSTSINTWQNNSEGNYWDDFNGIDSNGDGIGDTPYILDENNQDNYPLMNPVKIQAIPEFLLANILIIFILLTSLVVVFRNKVRKKG